MQHRFYDTPVWEQMEQHHNYNVEDAPEFSRTYLKQEITNPEPYENRLVGEYIKWFEPTDDFSNLENMDLFSSIDNIERRIYEYADVNESEYKAMARDRNYQFWAYQLALVETPAQLKEFRETVISYQQKHTITWKNETGEEITASIFFPKGHSRMLWDKYHVKKAQLVEEASAGHQAVIDEVKGMIAEYSDIQNLGALQKLIWKLEIPHICKSDLYGKCQSRIKDVLSA